jgi:predicted acetyltransferase
MPRLVHPTLLVRDSYLAGERELARDEASPDTWLDDAARDFGAFVESRRGVRRGWGVPVTELWYVDGSIYLGTLILRHQLTPDLTAEGGHIGFHIVPSHRRRGHATRMLADAIRYAEERATGPLLITCDVNNRASRRVIEANGGRLEDTRKGVARYWVGHAGAMGATVSSAIARTDRA